MNMYLLLLTGGTSLEIVDSLQEDSVLGNQRSSSKPGFVSESPEKPLGKKGSQNLLYTYRIRKPGDKSQCCFWTQSNVQKYI